jgi:hypothetical protein
MIYYDYRFQFTDIGDKRNLRCGTPPNSAINSTQDYNHRFHEKMKKNNLTVINTILQYKFYSFINEIITKE